MRQRRFILSLTALLALPAWALSAERSVIIGFKQRPGQTERDLIHREKGVIHRTYRVIPAVAARLPERTIARLRRSRLVAYVEENTIYTAVAAPRAASQLDDSWGVRRISADLAHTSGNRGTGIKIAVLDTGIDYTHEDLDDNYRGGHDFVFDDDDPMDDSFNSHGTHVAGIIAAEDNGVGVVGVAPEADLYAVKVLDGAGFGTEDWIIAGIDWAISNGIQVINLSIAGPETQGLREACERAHDAGVLVVAAAGNSLLGGAPVQYPAAYETVIAVTGTDQLDLPGYFAPVGPELELAAPGVDILSTVAGGSYDLLSGSSQAAPHVAGAAALYLSANTTDVTGDGLVNHEDVRWLLQLTATDLGETGKDEIYGYGLVNAADAAFESAPPVADPGGPYTGRVGQPVQLDGTGSFDPDGSLVAYLWDFGDGSVGQGPTPSHVYTAPGTYTVTLAVVDNDGSPSPATATVEIADDPLPPPTGDIWSLRVPAGDGHGETEFTITVEEFGGLMWFDERFADGQRAFGIGGQFDDMIFWMDSLGALFYGMVDYGEGTIMGIVFDFRGDPGHDTIFFGEW